MKKTKKKKKRLREISSDTIKEAKARQKAEEENVI